MNIVKNTKFLEAKMNSHTAKPFTKHNTKSSGVSAKTKPSAISPQSDPSLIEQELRQNMIQEAAYYKAEKRRFEPGFEMEDWLEAEAEVDETPRKLAAI